MVACVGVSAVDIVLREREFEAEWNRNRFFSFGGDITNSHYSVILFTHICFVNFDGNPLVVL